MSLKLREPINFQLTSTQATQSNFLPHSLTGLYEEMSIPTPQSKRLKKECLIGKESPLVSGEFLLPSDV
jgi:hypothetical protein